MKQFTLGTLGVSFLLGLSQQAFAHVQYYDLNQGAQIADLTAAGKTLSTAQYGSTPAAVLALAGNANNGLGSLSSLSDLPLNDSSQWNSTNQSYTGVGTFTNVTYTPASSTATVDVNDVTTFGWYNGTTPALGDSHKVDMFNFRLAQQSTVTISWNVDDGAGTYINSGFTLYRGFLTYDGHDDANEKLNPKVGFTTKVQDALDAVNAPVDVQGIASSFRDTVNGAVAGNYTGQFNALANWGQSNVSGNWSNVAYIQAVNNSNPGDGVGGGTAGESLESLTISLAAGNYTIAASGAVDPTLFNLTNLHGQLNFSAVATAPVPVPAAAWLFGSALAGLGVFARRGGKSIS